jgi:hypothetical protein
VSKYGIFNPFVLCYDNMDNSPVNETSILCPTVKKKSHMIIFAPEEMVSLQIINGGSTKYLQAGQKERQKDEKTEKQGLEVHTDLPISIHDPRVLSLSPGLQRAIS